ncbi:tyrosinase family protein [Bradyrhizobium sp. Pa8]|uniref:tyrosinase family protein n=1 Tax=Bradyrhizobium sp. Pa8 TaxID=3386552 RepID=UPI00403F7C27
MTISRRELVGGLAFATVDFAAIVSSPASAQQETNPKIEIEINNTLTLDDDYLTWAPTPARIKLAAPGPSAVTVTLTNDPDQAIPAGRSQPLDGRVAFAEKVAAGQTAQLSSLTLTLPPDGSWVPFVVAGAFPRASSADKDTGIEIHLGDATGPIIATHAVMVRIRKNIESLTSAEREAFLKAMRDLHMGAKGFEYFPQMHDLAAQGKSPYQEVKLPDGSFNPKFWPDQAHQGAAFLAWHRTFLLLFERRLQAINPAVTIPYWRQNVATTAFDRLFLGTNQRPVGTFQTEVIFSPANWLYGWSISYKNLKTVIRSPKDTSWLKRGNGTPLIGDNDLFGTTPPYPDAEKYINFSRAIENDPHNVGHALLGAWHASCLISPSDPSFWPFHAEDDRLWAKWQWFYGRFDTEGKTEDSYHFTKTFVPNDASTTTLGHNLKDTMWPWDGTKGRVFEDDNSRANHPDQNPFSPFPKATAGGIWPSADAKPRPADMIDYLGLGGTLPHGVAYDDVPYGVMPQPPVTSIAALPPSFASVLAETALDNQAPASRRIVALSSLRAAGHAQSQSVLQSVVYDVASPPNVRQLAATNLIGADPTGGAEHVLGEIQRNPQQALPLRAALIETAALVHHGQVSGHVAHQVHHLLTQIAGNVADGQAVSAAVSLAEMGDPKAGTYLVNLLRTPSRASGERARVVAALSLTSFAGTPVTLREVLEQAIRENDTETALAAVRVLAGDPDTRAMRLKLVDEDPNVDPLVNQAAIRSLMLETTDVLPKLLAYLEGSLNPAQRNSKLESAGAFRVIIQAFKPFPRADVDGWKAKLRAVRDGAPGTATELKEALDKTLDILETAST